MPADGTDLGGDACLLEQQNRHVHTNTGREPDPYAHENRGGAPATRADVLAYNGRWTDYDRRLVSAELDRIRDRTAYFWRTESNSYIRAMDAHGKALMYVGAGYLWWPEGRVDTLPEEGIADGDDWLLPIDSPNLGV